MLPHEADYIRLPDKTFFTVQAERNDSKSCEILQHLNIVQLVKQHAEPPDTFRKNPIFYSYITVRFWGQQQLLCTFKTYLIIILSSTRLMINIESRKLHLFKEVNPKCKPQKDYFASWPSFRAFVHTIIQAKSLLLYIYIYITTKSKWSTSSFWSKSYYYVQHWAKYPPQGIYLQSSLPFRFARITFRGYQSQTAYERAVRSDRIIALKYSCTQFLQYLH